MIPGSVTSSWQTRLSEYTNPRHGTNQTNTQARSAQAHSSPQDMLTLSHASQIKMENPQGLDLVQASSDYDSSVGKFAGMNSSSLRRYLINSTGETGLTGLNMNRKSIGSKIETILKQNGISLDKNDKLTISVDSQNKITVAGIKDKRKLKAITEALNEDEKLGREMRKHAASGRLNQYVEKQLAHEKNMAAQGFTAEQIAELGDDTNGQFTNRGIRSFVIEEFLQEKIGLGLADLSVEKGAGGTVSILGMNSELSALVGDDPELGKTLANILENGETSSSFSVSFEYANGAISDSTTLDAAKNKIQGIRDQLMGYYDEETKQMIPGVIDEIRKQLESVGGDHDKDLIQALSRGFSIRAGQNGEFEIVGHEGMNDRLKGVLKGAVEKALARWHSKEESKGPNSYTGGFNDPTFKDLVETYLEQHRFEHGDLEEHEHMLEINFSGGVSDVRVVSPEADEARDKQNQEVANKLGSELKSRLAESGVEIGQGIEVEIDETGKITVLGDLNDPNLKKAQTIIDQFTTEAKQIGRAESDDKDERQTRKESMDLRLDGKTDADVKPAAIKTANEHMKEKEYGDFLDGQMARFGKTKIEDMTRSELNYIAWQRVTPEKQAGKTQFASTQDKVSNIRKQPFAGLLEETSAAAGTSASGKEHGNDAVGLFRQLMDSMSQFHDHRRGSSYKFVIA